MIRRRQHAVIAHLELHGYVPYANEYGWVAIWSDAVQTGRMARFFEYGLDGPGWDVRMIISRWALPGYDEIPWHRLDDDQLAHLTAPVPPKFRHDISKLAAQPEEWRKVVP